MSERVVVRWTPAARETVLSLWGTGLSGSQIADRIGAEHGLTVTKSAVIGVAFRAGKSFSGPRTMESRARSRRSSPTEESRRRDRERKAAKKAAAPKPAPVLRPEASHRPVPARATAIPSSLRIPLTAIREGACRYIADDPLAGPATCCGHPAVSGSPWCAGHHALCTVAVRKPVSIWMPEHRRAA